MKPLYAAFKGSGNSSNRIVSQLDGEKIFLTNSLVGLRKEIENLSRSYCAVYIFGLDKELKGNIRIEGAAVEDGKIFCSCLDLKSYAECFHRYGIAAELGNVPKRGSLCNAAYACMLRKYSGNAVLIHVPSRRYINDLFLFRIKQALSVI